MEGIETKPFCRVFFRPIQMSVGAPTWRGLKPMMREIAASTRRHVSRCPDMEGIETMLVALLLNLQYMSVGAPTWRGLKLFVVSDSRLC